MAETLMATICNVTKEYLDNLNVTIINPQAIEADILREVGAAIEIHNNMAPAGYKWRIPQRLNFIQIALIMARLYDICCVQTAGAEGDSELGILAIYQHDGPNEGTYVTNIEAFRNIARKYCFTITRAEFKECMAALQDLVPIKNHAETGT